MMREIIVGAVTSFLAIVAGAIIINVPKKFLLPCGIGGVVCWVTYLMLVPFSNSIIANFWSGLIVAFYSQMMARVYKTPVTIFFIPSFLPLVPGYTIYRSAYYYIAGDNNNFSTHLSQTIQIATLIALAIFISDTFFRGYSRLMNK